MYLEIDDQNPPKLFLQNYFQIVFFFSALTNYIMIVRYISVFHLKNPGAIKDDFWCLFLNLWTVAATFILNGSNWYLLFNQLCLKAKPFYQ